MDIREFVKEALVQIASGIKDANIVLKEQTGADHRHFTIEASVRAEGRRGVEFDIVMAELRTIFAIAEYRSAVVWINVMAVGGIIYYLFIKEFLLASILVSFILVFLLSDIKSAFPYAEENFNLLQAKKNYNKHCRKKGLPELDDFLVQGAFKSIFNKLEALSLEQKKIR